MKGDKCEYSHKQKDQPKKKGDGKGKKGDGRSTVPVSSCRPWMVLLALVKKKAAGMGV